MAKISIQLDDGSILEGTVVWHTKHGSKSVTVPAAQQKPAPIMTQSANAKHIQKLEEKGFFKINPIVTTPELCNALRLKCNKKIALNHAAREFAKLVDEGVLQRDELDIRRGNHPTQIWYLPETSEDIVAEFKKNKGAQK